MQSEKTSIKPRKTAKAKPIAAAVEAPKAEVVKKARAPKSSPTKSSVSKKSDASPKHHHSAVAEKVSVAPAKVPSTNSSEDIARLAHSFWVERNYGPGSPEEDWFRAERELAQAR